MVQIWLAFILVLALGFTGVILYHNIPYFLWKPRNRVLYKKLSKLNWEMDKTYDRTESITSNDKQYSIKREKFLSLYDYTLVKNIAPREQEVLVEFEGGLTISRFHLKNNNPLSKIIEPFITKKNKENKKEQIKQREKLFKAISELADKAEKEEDQKQKDIINNL